MSNVDLSRLVVGESAKLQTENPLPPLIASAQTGMMYAFENKGLRAVLIGFDISKSDLPMKVAFPVMMSNIFNWLNPHKLEFSILQTKAGQAFDLRLVINPLRRVCRKSDVDYTIRTPNRYYRTRKSTFKEFLGYESPEVILDII